MKSRIDISLIFRLLVVVVLSLYAVNSIPNNSDLSVKTEMNDPFSADFEDEFEAGDEICHANTLIFDCQSTELKNMVVYRLPKVSIPELSVLVPPPDCSNL